MNNKLFLGRNHEQNYSLLKIVDLFVTLDCKTVVFFANASDAGSIRTKGLEQV